MAPSSLHGRYSSCVACPLHICVILDANLLEPSSLIFISLPCQVFISKVYFVLVDGWCSAVACCFAGCKIFYAPSSPLCLLGVALYLFSLVRNFFGLPLGSRILATK